MNDYRIKISVSDLLSISCNESTIGTQGDNRSARLIWTVPERFKQYKTKLSFHTPSGVSYDPYITSDTEFIIVDSLTRETGLFLRMAFIDDAENEIIYSNLLFFRFREGKEDGNTPITESGVGSINYGVEEAPEDGNLYGRQNKAWQQISNTGGIDFDLGNLAVVRTAESAQRVINEAEPGTVILLTYGDFEGNDIVIDSKRDINIIAVNPTGKRKTVVKGGIIITETSSNIGIQGISFENQCEINSQEGSIFENCSFEYLTTGTICKGHYIFRACSFSESTQIYGSPYIEIISGNFEDYAVLFQHSETSKIELEDVKNVTLNHAAGDFKSVGSTEFISINSTAVMGRGRLDLFGGTTITEMNKGYIDKSGDCPYSIHNFIYEARQLKGNRDKEGLHSSDIITGFEPSFYIPQSITVEGHLKGINEELGKSNRILGVTYREI